MWKNLLGESNRREYSPQSIAKVSKLIKKGKMDELEAILGRKDGRIDLSLVSLSNADQVIDEFSFKNMNIRMVNKPVFKGQIMRSFDFTEANMTSTGWENVVFEDCLFERTVMWDVIFNGCDFIECRFKNCEIENTLLGGSDRKKLGSFVNTTFSGGIIRNSFFRFPLFDNCVFGCNIENVDFGGSQFIDCKFMGRLEGVFFRGRAKPNSERKDLLKLHLPENEMVNVDFTNAWFDGVEFTDGIPMSEILLPKRNRIILIVDAHFILERARQIIQEEWSGDERKWGIGEINIVSRLLVNGQKDTLINIDVESRYFGEPFALRLAELINELNDTRRKSINIKP